MMMKPSTIILKNTNGLVGPTKYMNVTPDIAD